MHRRAWLGDLRIGRNRRVPRILGASPRTLKWLFGSGFGGFSGKKKGKAKEKRKGQREKTWSSISSFCQKPSAFFPGEMNSRSTTPWQGQRNPLTMNGFPSPFFLSTCSASANQSVFFPSLAKKQHSSCVTCTKGLPLPSLSPPSSPLFSSSKLKVFFSILFSYSSILPTHPFLYSLTSSRSWPSK